MIPITAFTMYESELYSNNNDGLVSGSRHFIRKYQHLLRWRRKPSILEIGSGDGNNTIQNILPTLPRDLKKLVISDKSQEMIDYASKRLQSALIRHLDISTDSVPEDLLGGFDHVLSFYMFHWVQKTDQALNNIYNLLKPGGQFFCVCCSEDPLDETFEELSTNPKWAQYGTEELISPYYKNRDVNQIYKKKLERNGFVDVFVQPDVYVHPHTDEEEWTRLMIAVNPTICKVPTLERDDYIKDYIDCVKRSKYVHVDVDEMGQKILHFKHDMIVMFARKSNHLNNI